MIFNLSFILLMGVIFILVWLFINTIDKRKWLSFLISLGLAPLVYFYLFYPMLNIFSSFYHQKHFNAERWKDKPSLRYEMTDEIINKNILIGKTKLEIEAILGKSEWNSWDETLKAHSPDIWHYNLGFKPGAFNKQQETMEILFSKDSLKTVRQYQTEHTFE